jgi:hypothetical protein
MSFHVAGTTHDLDVGRLAFLFPALEGGLDRKAVCAGVPEHLDDLDLAGRDAGRLRRLQGLVMGAFRVALCAGNRCGEDEKGQRERAQRRADVVEHDGYDLENRAGSAQALDVRRDRVDFLI